MGNRIIITNRIMMTTKVEADSEYFEHEFSSSLFKDIKQELVDEMLLTEKEDVKIDFDSEVQKVLSGLDLINCFIKNFNEGLEYSEYKIKYEQYLSSLKKIEYKLNKIRTDIPKYFGNSASNSGIDELTELETLMFPNRKEVSLVKSAHNFDRFDRDFLTKVKKFYQNVTNYNFETKENVIRTNWSGPQPMQSPKEIRNDWVKLREKIRANLEINIDSYDEVMEDMIKEFEGVTGECICIKSEAKEALVFFSRNRVCDEGAKFIKKYCGFYPHIGRVVLSQTDPHWEKCNNCSKHFEIAKQNKIKAQEKRKEEEKKNAEMKLLKEQNAPPLSDIVTGTATISDGKENLSPKNVNEAVKEYDKKVLMLEKNKSDEETILGVGNGDNFEGDIVEDHTNVAEYDKTESLKRKSPSSENDNKQPENVSMKKPRYTLPRIVFHRKIF